MKKQYARPVLTRRAILGAIVAQTNGNAVILSPVLREPADQQP